MQLPVEILEKIFGYLPIEQRIRNAREAHESKLHYLKGILFNGLIRDLKKYDQDLANLKVSHHPKWPLGMYESKVVRKYCERCFTKCSRPSRVPIYEESPNFILSGFWLCNDCVDRYILNMREQKQRLGSPKLHRLFIDEYSIPFCLSNGHWYPSMLITTFKAKLEIHAVEVKSIESKKQAKQKRIVDRMSLIQSWFPQINNLSQCPTAVNCMTKSLKCINSEREQLSNSIRHEWTFYMLANNLDIHRYHQVLEYDGQYFVIRLRHLLQYNYRRNNNGRGIPPDYPIELLLQPYKDLFCELFPGSACDV